MLKKIVGKCLRDIKTRNSKITGQSHEQTRQEDKLQSVYSIQIINKKTEQRAHNSKKYRTNLKCSWVKADHSPQCNHTMHSLQMDKSRGFQTNTKH